MSFFKDIFGAVTDTVRSYTKDNTFLVAASAAAALVIAADGSVEESEIEEGLKGLMDHPSLKGTYTNSQIEAALTDAINHAKTRAGRINLVRSIEAMATKAIEARQDVFLIACDTTGGNTLHGLGADEKAVLEKIGKALSVETEKLIAA